MVFGATGGNVYKQLIALAFYACITHKTNNSTVKEAVLFMVPLPRCGGALAQREKRTKTAARGCLVRQFIFIDGII